MEFSFCVVYCFSAATNFCVSVSTSFCNACTSCSDLTDKLVSIRRIDSINVPWFAVSCRNCSLSPCKRFNSVVDVNNCASNSRTFPSNARFSLITLLCSLLDDDIIPCSSTFIFCNSDFIWLICWISLCARVNDSFNRVHLSVWYFASASVRAITPLACNNSFCNSFILLVISVCTLSYRLIFSSLCSLSRTVRSNSACNCLIVVCSSKFSCSYCFIRSDCCCTIFNADTSSTLVLLVRIALSCLHKSARYKSRCWTIFSINTSCSFCCCIKASTSFLVVSRVILLVSFCNWYCSSSTCSVNRRCSANKRWFWFCISTTDVGMFVLLLPSLARPDRDTNNACTCLANSWVCCFCWINCFSVRCKSCIISRLSTIAASRSCRTDDSRVW